jgi:hypothetical protein
MKQKRLVGILYCVLIVGLIAGSFFVGKAIARPRVASAQDAIGAQALTMPGANPFGCPVIDEVAVFENRIHLHCNTVNMVGSDAVSYYVYSTDPAHATTANEILAIGNTAFALGDPMDLWYNADSALNPPGCNTGDCRGLTGAEIVP